MTDLKDQLVEALATELDPVTIAENRAERCDYGCRMLTVVEPVAADIIDHLLPVIEQYAAAERQPSRDLTLALLAETAPDEPELPEGWTERVESRWRVEGDWIGPGPASDSRPSVEKYMPRHAHIERRAVWVGPWEEER